MPLIERNLLPDPSVLQTWTALALTVVGLLVILALEALRVRLVSTTDGADRRL